MSAAPEDSSEDTPPVPATAEEEENDDEPQPAGVYTADDEEETSIDLYGQSHVEETPELISNSLKEFDEELEKTPLEEKGAYEQAKEKCPELLDNDFKLMFLRCGDFSATKAAPRFISYWDSRLDIFGPERAFLPLKLGEDGALKDDEIALSHGIMRLVGTKGLGGRNILFLDPSLLDHSKYTRESLVRSFWYVWHAAITGAENLDSQKHGVVFLVYPQNVKRSQFDKGLIKMVASSIKNCLPVRVSGIHYVHPPRILKVLLPIIKLFLGKKLRQRIRLHYGTEEEVLQQLEEFALTKDVLPTDVGGNISLDHKQWLEDRRHNGL